MADEIELTKSEETNLISGRPVNIFTYIASKVYLFTSVYWEQ